MVEPPLNELRAFEFPFWGALRLDSLERQGDRIVARYKSGRPLVTVDVEDEVSELSSDDERSYVNAELPEGQNNASRTILSALLQQYSRKKEGGSTSRQPTRKSELVSHLDDSMEHVRPQEVQTANVLRTPILVANKRARLQSRNVFSAPLNKEPTQSNTRRRRIACQKAGCRRSVDVKNVGRHVRTHVKNAPYSVSTDMMLQLCFPSLDSLKE